jgi:hypothetical protein
MSAPKYATDEERRAAKAERQRNYIQRLKDEGKTPPGYAGGPSRRRKKPARASDLFEPPTYCACGCGKRLTVAAVNGGSDFATRDCAGFGVESKQQADEVEPTAEDLAAEAPAEGDG